MDEATLVIFTGTKLQFWLSLFVGGFLGIVVGVLILNIFYICRK